MVTGGKRRISKRRSLLAAGIFLLLVVLSLRGPVHRLVRVPREAPGSPPQLVETVKVAKVLDGDSLVTKRGREVRLLSIDAPEREMPFHDRAREELRELVSGKTVKLAFDRKRKDRYGRCLAHVFVCPGEGKVFVSAELLRRGLASVYLLPPNLLFSEKFKTAQKEAVAKSKGIWSVPVKPEEFYLVGKYKFHRPSCPYARWIPSPKKMKNRKAILLSGKGLCRKCRP